MPAIVACVFVIQIVAISVDRGGIKYVTVAANTEHLPKFATDVPLAIAKHIWHYYSLLQNVLLFSSFHLMTTTATIMTFIMVMITERRSNSAQ